MYVCMYVCVYVCMYVCMCVYMHVCVYVYVRVRVYECAIVCVCMHTLHRIHTLSVTHTHAHAHTHTHTCTVLPLTSWSAPRARIIEYALCPYISRKMLLEVFALASFTVKIMASSHACASSSGTRCSYVLPVCVCIYMERESVCVCTCAWMSGTQCSYVLPVCVYMYMRLSPQGG